VTDPRLHALARRLVAPLRTGDALSGDGLAGDSTSGDPVLRSIDSDLAVEYAFVHGDATAHVEVVPREGARARRVHTQHFAVGHRGGTMAPAQALALCECIARRIAVNEDAALAELAATAGVDDRIREVTGGHALVRGPGEPLHYTSSPYRGCTIGCRFCYAQSRLQPLCALLGQAAVPWGSWGDAHVDMPAVLAEQLERLPPLPIKVCPIVADPYQPLERTARITRPCLEAIAACARPWSVLVLTRAHAILDDLPLLAGLPRAWVGVSLPTVDDGVRRHFEPRAASVAERLDVLRRFADAGLATFAVVQPMLPGDVDALADALRITTAGVATGALEGEEQADPLFDAHPEARAAAWQRERLARLHAALGARGIGVWTGELPRSELRA